MMSKINTFNLVLLTIIVAGCASGPGTNQHLSFEQNSTLIMPLKIKTDQVTRAMVASPMMSDDSVIYMAIGGGLLGYVLAEEPRFSGMIRGNFLVGEVFDQQARSFATTNSDQIVDTLHLKLVGFQQTTLTSSMFPGLEAFMDFEAVLDSSGEKTLARYECEWEGQDSSLLPGEEKNMLNEMIARSLFHWFSLLQETSVPNDDSISFPPPMQGNFTGTDVICSFNIFVKPENPATINDN